MAGEKSYSRHQQKIIKRYYEHVDTIALQQLGEIVTELYLAESKDKADRVWARVEKLLGKVDANPAEARKLLEDRSVERLAQLVSDLQRTGP